MRIQEQPLRLLELLLEQPGELVSRERLRERLWPSDTFVDFERSLNAAVAKLRQALHDSADRPVYVETVARKGYRFIAPVTETSTEPEPVTAEATQAASHPGRRRAALLAVAVSVLCASAVLLAWVKFRHPDTPHDSGTLRFTIATPEGTEIADASYVANVAISPDGRTLALVGSPTVSDTGSIWIRPLASEVARRLDGTEGAALPFWSPDSREIGFFAGGQLKNVPASSGPVRVLCDSVALPFGASWGREGVIVYSAGFQLYSVNASGGPCRQLTQFDKRHEFRPEWPYFLPDGRQFLLFTAAGNTTYLASLDNTEPKMVLANRNAARFAPPDKLLFVRNGILFAQQWDFGRKQVRGQPTPVATNVSAFVVGQSAFSVSTNGVLAYRSSKTSPTQLVCYSRDGKRLRSIGAKGNYNQFTLSPDEKVAALTVSIPIAETMGRRIWLLRLDTEVMSRYDFGRLANADPVWSPDSRRIVFASFEVNNEKSDLMEWTIGEERPRLLLGDGRENKPDDWSSDGRFLLYRRNDRLAMSIAMDQERKPIASGDRDFLKDQLRFSPDGTHVAYNAVSAGRMEVFVAAFPSFTGTVQVSSEGGVQPVWRGDGKELFYLAADKNLMSVPIRAGEPMEASAPKALFRTSLLGEYWGSEYAVSRDGQKVHVLEPASLSQDSLHVITQWDRQTAHQER